MMVSMNRSAQVVVVIAALLMVGTARAAWQVTYTDPVTVPSTSAQVPSNVGKVSSTVPVPGNTSAFFVSYFQSASVFVAGSRGSVIRQPGISSGCNAGIGSLAVSTVGGNNVLAIGCANPGNTGSKQAFFYRVNSDGSFGAEISSNLANNVANSVLTSMVEMKNGNGFMATAMTGSGNNAVPSAFTFTFSNNAFTSTSTTLSFQPTVTFSSVNTAVNPQAGLAAVTGITSTGSVWLVTVYASSASAGGGLYTCSTSNGQCTLVNAGAGFYSQAFQAPSSSLLELPSKPVILTKKAYGYQATSVLSLSTAGLSGVTGGVSAVVTFGDFGTNGAGAVCVMTSPSSGSFSNAFALGTCTFKSFAITQALINLDDEVPALSGRTGGSAGTQASFGSFPVGDNDNFIDGFAYAPPSSVTNFQPTASIGLANGQLVVSSRSPYILYVDQNGNANEFTRIPANNGASLAGVAVDTGSSRVLAAAPPSNGNNGGVWGFNVDSGAAQFFAAFPDLSQNGMPYDYTTAQATIGIAVTPSSVVYVALARTGSNNGMGVLLQTNAASMNPATFTITKTLDFYPMGLTVNTVPQFGSSAFKTDQVFVIVGNVNTTVNAARINYFNATSKVMNQAHIVNLGNTMKILGSGNTGLADNMIALVSDGSNNMLVDMVTNDLYNHTIAIASAGIAKKCSNPASVVAKSYKASVICQGSGADSVFLTSSPVFPTSDFNVQAYFSSLAKTQAAAEDKKFAKPDANDAVARVIAAVALSFALLALLVECIMFMQFERKIRRAGMTEMR